MRIAPSARESHRRREMSGTGHLTAESFFPASIAPGETEPVPRNGTRLSAVPPDAREDRLPRSLAAEALP